MIGKLLVSMTVAGAAITGGQHVIKAAQTLTQIQSQMILQAGKDFANPEATYTAQDNAQDAEAKLQAIASGKFDQLSQQPQQQ